LNRIQSASWFIGATEYDILLLLIVHCSPLLMLTLGSQYCWLSSSPCPPS